MPATFSVPTEPPGDSVPPDGMTKLAAIVPCPASVAPLATVRPSRAVSFAPGFAASPTSSSPALTATKAALLVPSRMTVPELTLRLCTPAIE